MSTSGDGRRVAVIGALSFFGQRLLGILRGDPRYKHLLGLDVRRPGPGAVEVRYEHIDLTEPAADVVLAGMLEREAIDTVVHLAYLSRPVHQQAWAHELESIGTMYMLNACARARVPHVVALSTTMCYGAHPQNPQLLGEERPLLGAQRSRWVSDKVDAEQQLASHAQNCDGTTVTVLRMAPTLGSSIDNYWTRILRRPVVHTLLGFDPPMQFLHEDDAAHALQLAVEKVPGGAFNIVPDDVLTLGQAVERLHARAVPLPLPLANAILGALWTAQVNMTPPGFLDYLRYVWLGDGHRAREVLGFRPGHRSRETIDDFARGSRGRPHTSGEDGVGLTT
ncbi:MAG: NAD-dependent epimerase/dehydratase family protein [Pseudomonadota bacterium]